MDKNYDLPNGYIFKGAFGGVYNTLNYYAKNNFTKVETVDGTGDIY